MPYTNDMQTLANIVGGGAAAQQAGIQDDLENQKQQIANQVAQGQAGAEIARPYLQNMFTGQQVNTQQGVAQQEQAKGSEAQALLPSNIGLGLAKNETQLSAEKIQRMQQVGAIANQAASYMDNIPPPARPAAMQGLAQKFGIDVSQLGPMASGDPDQLRQFSQSIVQGSQQYLTQAGLENVKGANQRANTEIENAGRLANTKEIVGGRTDVANIAANAKMMLAKTDNIIAALTAKQANGTLSQQEALTLNQARQAQQLARTNPFINQMIQGEGGVPNQMPQATAGPNAPSASPQTPMSAPAGNALEAEMRRRGLLQ